jgi:hypothetical protein
LWERRRGERWWEGRWEGQRVCPSSSNFVSPSARYFFLCCIFFYEAPLSLLLPGTLVSNKCGKTLTEDSKNTRLIYGGGITYINFEIIF